MFLIDLEIQSFGPITRWTAAQHSIVEERIFFLCKQGIQYRLVAERLGLTIDIVQDRWRSLRHLAPPFSGEKPRLAHIPGIEGKSYYSEPDTRWNGADYLGPDNSESPQG